MDRTLRKACDGPRNHADAALYLFFTFRSRNMITHRPVFGTALFTAMLAVTACGGEAPSPDGDAMTETMPELGSPVAGVPADTAATKMAMADLATAAGKAAGTATAMVRNGGLVISVKSDGMTAGDHGIHIHTTGKCAGPKFESAGDHWNPAGAKHGLSNPQGHHSGDMPNLTVAGDGSGALEYTVSGATLDQMLDDDGAAIVIHAKADDQMTDPSGDSGDRLACGVFRKS